MKTVFFIPVWNQIHEFPGLLRELKAAPPACDEILIVNNGSTDGSEKYIRESGYPYIDLAENRGIGYSFMCAIDWAIERGFDVFGVIAGNGKMLPSEMPRVLDPIRQGRADYVTGSRFLPGGASPNLPAFRGWAIPCVNVFAQALTGVRLTDATCGYRAYRLEVIRRAQFDWHAKWMWTYGFEYFLYAKVLMERSIRAIEVPVTMRYPGAGKRYSKIRPVLGWYEMLKPWILARLDGKGFKKS